VAKKKKSRVPTPPKTAATRTVQAPKPYHAARDPRRTRMLFIALGVVILLAGAGVGIAMAVGGGSSGAIEESQVCDFETFESAGRGHVDKRPKASEYNSTPPTSGPHFAQPRAPVIWNVYEEPLDQVSLVHNLEHGGMVIQYGSGVSDADVQKLREWLADDPFGLVLAPLPPAVERRKPELADQIAVTAWTHLMTCSAFDGAAMDDFSDQFRGPQGDAPEKFPLEALQPGSQ
jgi:Protein of unknown function (DUF3105)